MFSNVTKSAHLTFLYVNPLGTGYMSCYQLVSFKLTVKKEFICNTLYVIP